MSGPPPAPTTQQAPQLPDNSPWPEEKHIEALRTLDELERQLVNLRSVIPNVIHPLTANYPTPVAMFNDLSTRACSSAEDIANFTMLWTKSQHIFDRAKQSRAANANGIKQLGPSERFLPPADQPETTPAVKTEEPQPQPQDEDQDQDMMDVDEVQAPSEEVLRNFRERNPGVMVVEDGRGRLRITVPRPAGLVFVVETEAGDKVVVSSVRNASNPDGPPQGVHTAIMRAINTRKGGDLGRLLDMIVQYKSIFKENCAKCGKLMGGTKLQLPVVRRLVGGKEGERRWIAGHEECLS